MTDDVETRFRAVVRGRVQGVCFRAYTRDYARSLSINGYVRNCSDGAVEVEAQGDRGKLQGFLDWLHQGPPSARVKSVEVEWKTDGDDYRGFSVKMGGFSW